MSFPLGDRHTEITVNTALSGSTSSIGGGSSPMLRRPPLSPYRSPSSPPATVQTSSRGAGNGIPLPGGLEGGENSWSGYVPIARSADQEIITSATTPNVRPKPHSDLNAPNSGTPSWRRAKGDIDSTRSASLRLGLEPMRLVDLEGSSGRRLPPTTEPLVKYVPIERTHETTVIVRPVQPAHHDQSSSTSASSPYARQSNSGSGPHTVASGTSPITDDAGPTPSYPTPTVPLATITIGTSPLRPAQHQSPIRAAERLPPDAWLARANLARSPPRGRIGAYAPHPDLDTPAPMEYGVKEDAFDEVAPVPTQRATTVLEARLLEQQLANEESRRELARLAFERLVAKAAAFMECEVPDGDGNFSSNAVKLRDSKGSSQTHSTMSELKKIRKLWSDALKRVSSSADAEVEEEEDEAVIIRSQALQEYLHTASMLTIFGTAMPPPKSFGEEPSMFRFDDSEPDDKDLVDAAGTVCPIVGAHSLGIVAMCEAEVERLEALRDLLVSKQQRKVERMPWRDAEREAEAARRSLATLEYTEGASDEEDDSVGSSQASHHSHQVTHAGNCHWDLVSAPADDEDPFYYYRCEYTSEDDVHADIDFTVPGASEYVDCSARFGASIGQSPFSANTSSKCIAIIGYPPEVPLPVLFETLEDDYGIPVAGLYRGAGWANESEMKPTDGVETLNPFASIVIAWVIPTLKGSEDSSIKPLRIMANGAGNISGALAVGSLPLRVPKWMIDGHASRPFIECAVCECTAENAAALAEAGVAHIKQRSNVFIEYWRAKLSEAVVPQADPGPVKDLPIRTCVPSAIAATLSITKSRQSQSTSIFGVPVSTPCSIVDFLLSLSLHTSQAAHAIVADLPTEQPPAKRLKALVNKDARHLSEAAATLNALMTAYLSILSHDVADPLITKVDSGELLHISNAISTEDDREKDGTPEELVPLDLQERTLAAGADPPPPYVEEDTNLRIRRVESNYTDHGEAAVSPNNMAISIETSNPQFGQPSDQLNNDEDILSIHTKASTSATPTNKIGGGLKQVPTDSALKQRILKQLRAIFLTLIDAAEVESTSSIDDDVILYRLFTEASQSEGLRVELLEPLASAFESV